MNTDSLTKLEALLNLLKTSARNDLKKYAAPLEEALELISENKAPSEEEE